MVQVTSELLRQMVEVIVDEVNPDQIVLFGSRARGDFNDGSDVDLIVLESRPFGLGRNQRQEEVHLYRALSRFHVPKDILVFTREDADYWRDSLNHVLARALREGRVLYERR